MTTMTTTVVIHGSALTTPAAARDVDAIYVGDRDVAERVARGWAGDHGVGGLPLDMHQSRYATICVPTPRGETRPYLRLGGGAPVKLRPVGGLAAAMRRAAFDLAAFDAAFSDAGGGCRFGLTESDRAESDEWDAYVEGPAALRAALRHVRPEAWAEVRRARPERADFVEALAEHGGYRLGTDLLCAIGGQAGGSPQKHICVRGAECEPLYSRQVGPWPVAVFTAMLRGGIITRSSLIAVLAAELAACREVGDADGGVAIRRVAGSLGLAAELCP